MTTKLKPKTKDWRKYIRRGINTLHCKPACFGKTGHWRKAWPSMPDYAEQYAMQYYFDIATKQVHASR